MSDNSDNLAGASQPRTAKQDSSRRVTPILHMGHLRDDSFMDFRPMPVIEDVELPEPPEDVKAELEKEAASDHEDDGTIEVAPKGGSAPTPAESQESPETSVPNESETIVPAPASSETTASPEEKKTPKKPTVKRAASGSQTSSSSQKSG